MPPIRASADIDTDIAPAKAIAANATVILRTMFSSLLREAAEPTGML
jgi:hypothetical protein